jgi:hypothetical protein
LRVDFLVDVRVAFFVAALRVGRAVDVAALRVVFLAVDRFAVDFRAVDVFALAFRLADGRLVFFDALRLRVLLRVVFDALLVSPA